MATNRTGAIATAKWILPDASSEFIPSSDIQTVTINAAGKYFDRDVEVRIGAASSGTAATFNNAYINETSGITFITRAGYTNTAHYITQGALPSTGTASITLGNNGGVTHFVETTPATGDGTYYTINIDASGTVKPSSNGWLTTGDSTAVSGDKDFYITKSTLSAAADPGVETNDKLEIQPGGTGALIKAGYYAADRYVFANKADISSEVSVAASGFSMNVTALSGSSALTVGTLDSTNKRYPLTANNLSVTANFSATTAGWFNSATGVIDSDTDDVTVGYIAQGVNSGKVSTHTKTDATYNYGISAPVITTDTSHTHTATGFVTTQPTAGPYITLAPTSARTAYGTSTAKAKGSITTAGYLPKADSSESAASTLTNIDCVGTAQSSYYVKIYDGAYTLA